MRFKIEQVSRSVPGKVSTNVSVCNDLRFVRNTIFKERDGSEVTEGHHYPRWFLLTGRRSGRVEDINDAVSFAVVQERNFLVYLHISPVLL